jgi:regulator of protease activity HflC (stomatin/prohibitin superfamily)
MEKTIKTASGWLMLFVLLALLAAGTTLLIMKYIGIGVALVLIGLLIVAPGFIAIEPNSSRVMNLFGHYIGTIKDSGFFYTNPFYTIMIGAVVTYRVRDTYKAAFAVENYPEFVKIQSETAMRKLAGMYSYDNWEDGAAMITLRSSFDEVNHQLALEIGDRLEIAGIEIIEARINNLAYATEIAQAMLQRQQATAIVAARSTIVEGAVGMVEMALHQLSNKNIIDLDDEKKAAMVSNLLVVLCGDRNAQPIVNTGTLHQ